MKTNKFIGLLLLISLAFPIKNFGQCQELDTLGLAMLQDSLATYFPNICKKTVIGTSVQNRDIIALKFSDNVSIDETEPEILLLSCIHGDETNPEQVMMKLARKLCLQYGADQQITDLINNREIWIIPVANPDGLVGEFGSSIRPNANYVDLNRNFGYMWNPEFGLQDNPSAYSEPETKIIRDFILSRNFNIMIDYHSGLQGIIYPWYYKANNCPDFTEIRYLAEQYDLVSGYPSNEFAVTAGADLYVSNGAMVEFAYGSLGIYAYAVELMDFGHPVYNSCELLTINMPAIFLMVQKAGEGITGIVTDAATTLPIQAKITIQGRVPFYSSNVNGDYHHFLKAGNYSVTVSANGYNTRTTTVNVVTGSATTHNFQLTPGSSFSAQKLLSCRNYNNYNDPAETWNALGMNDGAYYAIGDTGYVVVDMGAMIVDVPGNDITIHGDASEAGNGFELFHSSSIDGFWTSLGTGNSTTSFDISGATNIRYLRIEDNGTGAGNVLGAGFHLDAVTAGDLSVGINENNITETVTIYPNPTAGEIHIDDTNFKDFEAVNVFDNRGILVLKSSLTNTIDLSVLSNGVYYIQLYSKHKLLTYKIIKQ